MPGAGQIGAGPNSTTPGQSSLAGWAISPKENTKEKKNKVICFILLLVYCTVGGKVLTLALMLLKIVASMRL